MNIQKDITVDFLIFFTAIVGAIWSLIDVVINIPPTDSYPEHKDPPEESE